MDTQIIDSKLKNLIKLCNITGNYKKLAVVGWTLVSHKVDEISIKLGIRSRKKGKNEHLFTYLQFINQVFMELIKINIFSQEIIEGIKKFELLFLKLGGNFPYNYIKDLYSIYYDLRKLEIPNYFKAFENSDMHKYSDLNQFLSTSQKRKWKKKNNIVKDFLLYNICQREAALQQSLNNTFDNESFEQVLFLNKLKKIISSKSKSYINFKRKIDTNYFYQVSQYSSLKYILFGGIITFVLLGSTVLWESIMLPNMALSLSLYTISFLGMGIILFFVYHKFFSHTMGI